MIKLSKPGKMPCKSWSLQAIDTCPGAKAGNGLVPACQGCYATTGNYRFPNVKAPREHNREDWRRADWVNDMTAALANESYFRWFDSGDLYHVDLARKILCVIKNTPDCQHWIPTRMHKFAKFAGILADIEALPNAVVRRSSDGIHGEVIAGRNSSTIFHPDDSAPGGAVVCPAYSQEGKCGDCRACWNRDIAVIAYPQHGKKMAKVDILVRATS